MINDNDNFSYLDLFVRCHIVLNKLDSITLALINSKVFQLYWFVWRKTHIPFQNVITDMYLQFTDRSFSCEWDYIAQLTAVSFSPAVKLNTFMELPIRVAVNYKSTEDGANGTLKLQLRFAVQRCWKMNSQTPTKQETALPNPPVLEEEEREFGVCERQTLPENRAGQQAPTTVSCVRLSPTRSAPA